MNGSLIRRTLAAALLAASSAAFAQTGPPAVAAHQHLISPATAALWGEQPFTAKDLIAQLDTAGIRRGVVLSVAYTFADERKHVADEQAKVEAENNWTSNQVSLYPDRLVAFCSVNPLSTYAHAEIERCRHLPHTIGLKLHFGNSGVSLRNPTHLARMIEVFRTADRDHLPIVVHMRTRTDQPYGREDAELFLNKLLPAAPHITVQIAHLAGAGPGYPDWADEAMAVFANAIAAHDPRTRHVIFDVTTVVTTDTAVDNAALIATRLRQVGLTRVYFGTDLSIHGNPPPAEQWQTILAKLPLTPAEFATLQHNVTPYLH